MNRLLLASAVLGVFAMGTVAAQADTVVIGTESATDGFVGPLPVSGPSITVGSDGEDPFDPVAFGADLSDFINSSIPLIPLAGTEPYWVQMTNGTWVLPADLSVFGFGVENGVTFEPLGQWTFATGPGTIPVGQWVILEADGITVADVITYDGNILSFQSDPVPEPATLGVLLGGGALALLRRRRR